MKNSPIHLFASMVAGLATFALESLGTTVFVLHHQARSARVNVDADDVAQSAVALVMFASVWIVSVLLGTRLSRDFPDATGCWAVGIVIGALISLVRAMVVTSRGVPMEFALLAAAHATAVSAATLSCVLPILVGRNRSAVQAP